MPVFVFLWSILGLRSPALVLVLDLASIVVLAGVTEHKVESFRRVLAGWPIWHWAEHIIVRRATRPLAASVMR